MTGYLKKTIALSVTAIMVLATLVSMASALTADEGAVAGRVNTPAPQWKVGDFWKYGYVQRDLTSTQTVTYGGGTQGSVTFTGKSDVYSIDTVTSKDSTYFYLQHEEQSWTNGTYTLVHPQAGTSSAAGFKWWSKWVSTTPDKVRMENLADGASTWNGWSGEEYLWATFQGQGSTKFLNTSIAAPETATLAVTNSPDFTMYSFPMDVSKSWPAVTTQISHFTNSGTTEVDTTGTAHTYSTDYTDTINFNYQGSTDSDITTRTCQAGTFSDCFKVRVTGTYDISRQGQAVNDGTPSPITGSLSGAFFDTYRYYSNKAGNIVDFNSTAPNNGFLLDSYKYTEIPPNYRPAVQEVAQQTYSPAMTIAVKEEEAYNIDMTVLDNDRADTINWTVISITGAGTNPAGAVLMDSPPQFTVANPTSGDLNGIHTNTLRIVAKQPKTVDRDEYTLKVNVSDGRDNGAIEFTFKVKVLNVNDKPYVAMNIPDIWMNENSTMTCTTWKLTDIFKDADKDAGIDDPLTFMPQVTSGPGLTVEVDNSTGTVTLKVPDYASWPVENRPSGWDNNQKESQIKFTATDSGCGNIANKTSNLTTAKLKIVHQNHAPELSTNGTQLQEKGLAWNEDTVDGRLNLKVAFDDVDTTYAGDTLTYANSGQKSIGVKIGTDGKVTMTPEKDWNGKETIKFTATDAKGAKKELRVECEVLAVNDLPFFCETEMDITWEDNEPLTIKEATGPTGTLTKLTLAVSVKDPDIGDTHSCMWYVNDTNGNTVFKSTRAVANDDDYEFKAAWTGAFSAQGSPYEVKVVVTDLKGAATVYMWNVTVLNVNRPPTATFDNPIDNKSFLKGKAIYFDGFNSSDPDELKDNLTYIWNSSKQGTLGQGKGQTGAQMTLKNLKVGKHIVTLTVLDSDGGESLKTFTVKVSEPVVTPGFEMPLFVLAAMIAVVVMAVRRKKN